MNPFPIYLPVYICIFIKKKKIHCFLMHRKIFEKKEKRERIDIHVDRTSGITRFPGTNMMGWIQRLQRNPNRPPNHYTIKKKKHFSLIYFPPPFTFIAVKLVSTFFFFFFSFTRLKASRSTAKPFPFWRIKPVFFNQHEDKHVNVFNLFEKKWNKIPLLLFRSFDDSKGAPHPQLENGRKISITSSRLPRFLSEVEPLCPNN